MNIVASIVQPLGMRRLSLLNRLVCHKRSIPLGAFYYCHFGNNLARFDETARFP